MPKPTPRFLPSALIALGLCASITHAQQKPNIIRLELDENDVAVDFDFVNPVTGWQDYFNAGFRGGSTSIGILESGHAWFGHEAFIRPPGSPAAFTTWNNNAPDAINELDYHATTVAHVAAGSGYVPTNGGSYTFAGLGMAPEARVVTGTIATSFSTDPDNLGGFNISTPSLVTAYKEFFRGTNVGKLDVINSSWGGGGDGAANSTDSLSLDGLAFQNPTTAHVISAGNGGNAQVGAPGNGFNNISVGSLGGLNYDTPSTFSSKGLADFHNPVTGITTQDARVAVDIAAPGEDFFLAAYLGNSGSIGAIQPNLPPNSNLIAQEPPPTDLYFTAISGTSYSAPIVAGGIALLKDVARDGIGETPQTHPDSFDTRTIKSVIMAGSDATVGWNNGQNQFNVTTQALDTTTGAGQLNLLGAANVYLADTRDSDGGPVSTSGWALTTVNINESVDFVFNRAFNIHSSLTIALNWFAVRDFDDTTLGEDIAFANLDLQIWQLDDQGGFLTMVGASQSTYNNTEFLRINSLAPGQYAMRVLFPEMIYDTSTTPLTSETFAIAWSAIPEPGSSLLIACSLIVVAGIRRRRSQ
jgi:hypothetical protein